MTNFMTGIMKPDSNIVKPAKETTHSASVETLAFHAALIGLVYLITYLWLTWLGQSNQTARCGAASSAIPSSSCTPLIWALIVRVIMEKIGIGRLIDPGMQKRITGLAVDYLLVSSHDGHLLCRAQQVHRRDHRGHHYGVSLVTFLMIEFFRRREQRTGAGARG